MTQKKFDYLDLWSDLEYVSWLCGAEKYADDVYERTKNVGMFITALSELEDKEYVELNVDGKVIRLCKANVR